MQFSHEVLVCKMDPLATHKIDSEIQRIIAKLRKYSKTLQGDCTKERATKIYKKVFPLAYRLRKLRRIVDGRRGRTTYK